MSDLSILSMNGVAELSATNKWAHVRYWQSVPVCNKAISHSGNHLTWMRNLITFQTHSPLTLIALDLDWVTASTERWRSFDRHFRRIDELKHSFTVIAEVGASLYLLSIGGPTVRTRNGLERHQFTALRLSRVASKSSRDDWSG
jgi:hypothetical protein